MNIYPYEPNNVNTTAEAPEDNSDPIIARIVQETLQNPVEDDSESTFQIPSFSDLFTLRNDDQDVKETEQAPEVVVESKPASIFENWGAKIAKDFKQFGDEVNQKFEEINDQTQKNNEKIAKHFEELGEKIQVHVEQVVHDTKISALKTGTAAMRKLLFGDLLAAKEQDVAELNSITGNDNLQQLLTASAPKLSETIQNEIKKLDIKDASIKEYLSSLTSGEGLLIELFEALIPRIIINLEKHRRASLGNVPATEEDKTDPVVRILLYVISVMNRHFHTIHSKMKLLDPNLDENAKKQAIRAIFAPLSEDLLKMALPNGKKDLPVASILRPVIWGLLKNSVLSDNLYELYFKMTELQLKSRKDEFAEVAGEHSELLVKFSDLGTNIIEKFLPKVISSSSSMIAEKAVKEIWGDSVPQQEWLQQSLFQLFSSDNPELLKLWKFVGHSFEAVFSNLVVDILKSNDQTPILQNLLKIKQDFVDTHGDEVKRRLALTKNASEDPELLLLFAPVAEQVLAAIGMENETKLPVPKILQDVIFPELKKELIKGLILAHTAMLDLTKDDDYNRDKLNSFHNSSAVSEACDIISQWVVDFLPSQLLVQRDDLVDMVYTISAKQIGEMTTDGAADIADYLTKHSEELKNTFSEQLKWIGEGQDESLKQLQPMVKGAIESLLLNLFVKRIGLNAPNADVKFKTETAVKLIDVISDHFAQLSNVKKTHNNEPLHKINEKAFLEEFGDKLHAGVSNTDEALKEHEKVISNKKLIKEQLAIIQKEKNKKTSDQNILLDARQKVAAAKQEIKDAEEILNAIKKEKFFYPMSEKLLKLFDLESPEKLNMPRPIARKLLESLKSTVIPEGLASIYKMMLDPHKMNEMMMVGMDAFDVTMKKIESGEININSDENTMDGDADLNKACGEMLLGVSGLFSDKLMSGILAHKKVRGLIAAQMGAAMTHKLNQEITLESIIESGCVKILPELQSKTDGKVASIFAKTAEEIEDLDIKKMNEELDLEQKLKDRIVKTATSQMVFQTKLQTVKPIQDLWKKFQDSLNGGIHKAFGKIGLSIKKFFDALFSLIFFAALGKILELLTFIPRKTVGLIVTAYLKGKVEGFIKNKNLIVHESLAYKISDTLVDLLQKQKEAAAAPAA